MLQRSPTFSRRILPSIRWRPSCANWACAPTGCTRSCGAPSSPRWTAKFACPSNIPRKCARGSSSRRALLPEGFDVEKHFNPSYRPWQQRIALVPDGDLFAAIRSGKASVVTDGIERFDATGVRLVSGAHLDADIIVTATGFNMRIFGGVPFFVDGESVDFAKRVSYRGMMIEGVPNMAYVMGYFRSLDAARGSGHRSGVPHRRAHGAGGPRHGGSHRACRGRRHAAPALDRSGERQLGLHHAGAAPAASPGRSSSLEARPGVRRGAGLVPAARPDEAALAYR